MSSREPYPYPCCARPNLVVLGKIGTEPDAYAFQWGCKSCRAIIQRRDDEALECLRLAPGERWVRYRCKLGTLEASCTPIGIWEGQ